MLDGKLAAQMNKKWSAPVWQHYVYARDIKSDLLQLAELSDEAGDEASGAVPEGVVMLLKDFSEDKEHVICMNCFRFEDRPLKKIDRWRR
jgi:hypothetical protein